MRVAADRRHSLLWHTSGRVFAGWSHKWLVRLFGLYTNSENLTKVVDTVDDRGEEDYGEQQNKDEKAPAKHVTSTMKIKALA